MNEFDFIKSLLSFSKAGINGIGDDCVLLDDKYLISKDILVSGVHFLKSAPIDLIIHKLFTCNVSDIASMGGVPLYVIFGISAPKDINLGQVSIALKKSCKFYNVDLIGGDTTESNSDLFLSLTIIGKKNQNILLRSGAKKGDILYLSRIVGKCKASLENELEKKFYNIEKYYHYKINAENEVGAFLGSKDYITSATDVSDGLGIDLSNISKMSDVKIIINKEKLNFSELDFLGDKKIDYILSSGEEYSIAFTVASSYKKEFEKEFIEKFNKLPIEIGYIDTGKGTFLRDNDKLLNIENYGYCHFSK